MTPILIITVDLVSPSQPFPFLSLNIEVGIQYEDRRNPQLNDV